jgi:hypothetical protein
VRGWSQSKFFSLSFFSGALFSPSCRPNEQYPLVLPSAKKRKSGVLCSPNVFNNGDERTAHLNVQTGRLSVPEGDSFKEYTTTCSDLEGEMYLAFDGTQFTLKRLKGKVEVQGEAEVEEIQEVDFADIPDFFDDFNA